MMGKDKSIRSQMSVNEVAGLLDGGNIKSILQEKCKAETTAIDGSCKLLDPVCRNPRGTDEKIYEIYMGVGN